MRQERQAYVIQVVGSMRRLVVVGMIATLVVAGVSAPTGAQEASPSPETCRPVQSGAQGQSATAACATSAAIIEAAVRARGGTPTASPGAEQTGELATRLPPADLPSTNEQGYSYDLEASLTADLNATPAEAPVYRLVPDPVTASGVADLAARLGVEGEVESRGNDVYVVSGNGDLFATSTLIQYIAPPGAADGEVPPDEAAVLAARDWLQQTGLAPVDLGQGAIVAGSPEAGRLSVQFSPLEPERLLAAYPSAVVAIGAGGSVLEARLQWPRIEQYDLYRLRGSEPAWRDVEAGRAYIEAPLDGSEIEQGSRIEGTVVYESIQIGYTTSGLPDGEQFLQPIYIFTGQVTPSGSDRSFPLSAYVPALVSSRTPVG